MTTTTTGDGPTMQQQQHQHRCHHRRRRGPQPEYVDAMLAALVEENLAHMDLTSESTASTVSSYATEVVDVSGLLHLGDR